MLTHLSQQSLPRFYVLQRNACSLLTDISQLARRDGILKRTMPPPLLSPTAGQGQQFTFRLDQQVTIEQSSSPSFHLPALGLSAHDDEVVEVRVLDRPVRGEKRGMVWIVDSQPAKQLANGQKIVLRTSEEMSGVGRLSNLDGMYRHWASFVITGGPPSRPCSLRVPIPWSSLSALESHAHTKHYASLPKLPSPHPAFLSNPLIASDEESPYEFEVWEDEAMLDSRLARITAS